MKKLTLTFLSAAMLSSAIAWADEDKIIASYKGGEVKESQVMQHFQAFLNAQAATKDKKFSDLDSNLQETLLRGFINHKLLDQEAQKAKTEESKEFQEKLNNIKAQLMQQALIENYVKSAVTEAAIKAEYDKMTNDLKDKEEIKVSHILAENEKKAKEIKKKLSAKGAKFASVAKESSKDEGSKANGGELGYITEGSLVPEFEKAAFALKPGEVSEPVKTQFGWHIIKVDDKRPAKAPTFEEAKANITAKLNKEAIEKYITELNSKAEVKLNLPAKIEIKPNPSK